MAKKKENNLIRVNGVDVRYNKNWAICEVPDYLSHLRGRQLFTLAPNKNGELVRSFTNVTEEIYNL